MSHSVKLVSCFCVTQLVVIASLVGVAQQTSHSAAAKSKQGNSLGTLVISLRDVETGYGVQGTVGYAPAPGPWRQYLVWEQDSPQSPDIPLKQRKTDASGRLSLTMPAGSYLLEVKAPGYATARSRAGMAVGKASGSYTFELHPIQEPEELKQADSLAKPGFAVAVGYVLDAATLRPVEGARIQENNSGVVTTSNARGFYALEVPFKTEPWNRCPNMLAAFSVNAPGYKEVLIPRQLLYDNQAAGGLSFEIERGSGTVVNKEVGAWDPSAPAEPPATASAGTSAWWEVKPERLSQRKPGEEVKKWQALQPQIQKSLAHLQEYCGGNYDVRAGIVDAAKFRDNGPEVALVDVCPMGAYTEWILPMQLENGQPVISKSRGKDGKLSTFEFASGSSAMNTGDVRLVPEDKVIYSIDYYTDGCSYLLTCRVTAYAWNDKSRHFEWDAALTRRATQGYCNSVQEGLKQSPRNPPELASPLK